MGQITLPKPNSRDEHEAIECASMVIVGANGSGKSRLGIWVESHADSHAGEIHRISAQRSLVFKEHVSPKSKTEAESLLLYGGYHERADQGIDGAIAQARNKKRVARWGQRPESHLLNDFDHVLSLLLAHENLLNATIKKQAQSVGIQPEDVPRSQLDRAVEVWQSVMPHRQLELDDNRFYGKKPDGERYSGLGMSDGERVAFYLIAQAMCVPENSLVIVDEPEVHLHKAIQASLWDAIERERSDCTFLYITHDLEFAASRPDATLIWAKSFDGSAWDWMQVDPIDGFPTDLTLEILGSRRPVLFVEGTADSIDTKLYRRIYPLLHILPRGSCHKVIESTRALRQSDGFHGAEAFGLIDRDFRSDAELAALEDDGVFATPVAEAENVYCMDAVITAAATHEEKPASEVLKAVKSTVVAQFKKSFDDQVTRHARHEVHHRLSLFDRKSRDRSEFVQSVTAFKDEVDPGIVFDEQLKRLQKALNDENYGDILKLFNRKGLFNQVCQFTGKTVEHFPTWVLRELDKAGSCEKPSQIGINLLNTLRAEFPVIVATEIPVIADASTSEATTEVTEAAANG